MNSLANLNQKQKESVFKINGPMLIIAGAGSGKTRVITQKIAHMVENEIDPKNILALTFTDKAASEMTERVNSLLPSTESPTISTFHSFSNDILEENVFSAGLNPDFKLIDETSQLVFFSKNMRDWKLKTMDTSHNITGTAIEVKKILSKFKDENITPQKIEDYIESFKDINLTEDEQNELDGLNDVRICYEEYEKYKKENNFIDFGDMLFLVHKIFSEKPKILEEYQDRYKYILVDEFQDTNYIQLMVLNLLAKRYQNITIVGDDDQSIYRFRGAHSSNIEDFKKLYPNNTEVILEDNYRCNEPILSVANDIIKNKPRGTLKKLIANKKEGENVKVIELQKDQDQYNFITKEILELNKKGRSFKDIAILVRRKRDAEPLIDTFEKYGINYEFVGEVSFFDEPIIKDILSYLRFLENPVEENTSLHRILSRDVYWLRKVEIARLGKFSREKRVSLFESFDHLNEIRNIDKHKFEFVKNELVDLLDIKDKVNILELVRKIIYKSGFYSYEISLGNDRNVKLLEHFDKFVSNFKRLNEKSHLKEFLEYIDLASGFEIDTYDDEDSNDVIKILTIHASKGKEFPIVFIPDLVENRLPTRYREDKYSIPKGLLNNPNIDFKSDHVNEERRLLYVAITRAMESLYLTYSKRYGDNKRDSKVSRFLKEIRYMGHGKIDYKKLNVEAPSIEETSLKGRIKERYIKSIVSDLKSGLYEKSIPKVLLLQKLEDENQDPLEILETAKELDYNKMLEFAKSNPIDEGISEDHSFSATQFNTYKKCPRQYQYSNVYNIRGRTSHYLELGLSIHKSVERITELIKNNEEVDIKKASEILKDTWIATSYETKEHELENYKDAKEMIKNFLEGQKQFKTEIHELEKPFTIELNGQSISGSIDRIDKENDEFILIDYKTSKTEESDTQVKQNLQLLLYSLACKKLYGKYPKKVGLWYLRSNKRIMVEIDPEMIDNLKEEIIELMKKIKKGEFKPTPGWHCKSCDYANICDSKQ